MLWTPARLPPHPSTVSTPSPLALAALRHTPPPLPHFLFPHLRCGATIHETDNSVPCYGGVVATATQHERHTTARLRPAMEEYSHHLSGVEIHQDIDSSSFHWPETDQPVIRSRMAENLDRAYGNRRPLAGPVPDLHFKEIKITQSRMNSNSTKLEPSDQTFVFEERPKYIKSLDKFRNNIKNVQDKPFTQFLKPISKNYQNNLHKTKENFGHSKSHKEQNLFVMFEKNNSSFSKINKRSNHSKITNTLKNVGNSKSRSLSNVINENPPNVPEDLCSQESLFVRTQCSGSRAEEQGSPPFDIDNLFSCDNHHLNGSSLNPKDESMFKNSCTFQTNVPRKSHTDGDSRNTAVYDVLSEHDADVILFGYPKEVILKTPDNTEFQVLQENEKPQYENKNAHNGEINGVSNNNMKIGNKSIELDIQIVNGKVQQIKPTPLTTLRPLKQSTLFDCKAFVQRDTVITKKSTEGQVKDKSSSLEVETKLHTENSIPNIKSSKLKATNVQCSNTREPGKSKLKNKCALVQQTLVNMDITKRSSTTPDNPKPKKKVRFTTEEKTEEVPPLTELDQAGAQALMARLDTQPRPRLALTITFREGYTLLNKPREASRAERCLPSGVVFLAEWESAERVYYWLPLLEPHTSDEDVRAAVGALLTTAVTVAVFEAQAVLLLLRQVVGVACGGAPALSDPLVGCWLLDPDHPPKDFSEAAGRLDMDPAALTVPPHTDPRGQACTLLPVLWQAVDRLQGRLAHANLWALYSDMEMRLVPLLVDMETSSILVDVITLRQTAAIIDQRLTQLKEEANKLAGHPFQINSHLQLRKVLFDELKLHEKHNLTEKQTEKGSKSTCQSVLEELRGLHPLAGLVLEYRHLHKVRSTYVAGLIQHVGRGGAVSCTWEQVGGATGRLTCSGPNLQAVPRTPVTLPGGAIHLRGVFTARQGHTFLSADFQQIELRVFAHFTRDHTLLQAFHESGDIFERLAARWLGGAGPDEREKTKRLVYSVMYGAGPCRLAEYLAVDPGEAARIINNFVEVFPSLRSLPQTVVAQCRRRGHVTSLSGRRRLFPHINSHNAKLRSYSERQAVNFLIQGSAADVCKAAMLDSEAALRARGLAARLLLQVHDELVWEVPDAQLELTAETVRRAMAVERLGLCVPAPVSVTQGKTLADTS